MTTTLHRSVCPYDCPDACGLMVRVENERAVDVSGDPEHPFTRGALCPKMNRYQDTVHHPERLTTPLLRVGPKGSGDFAPIGWDEALERITGRWRAILSEQGAEAILPYSYAGTMGLVQRNAGHAFFHRLGASRLDRTICSPAKAAGWSLVLGTTPSVHPDACRASDLILIWGMNAAATNVHGLHAVREAKRNGAQVWLIDTYANATAPLCDRVVVVKPGSDGALALGLLHLLDVMGLADGGLPRPPCPGTRGAAGEHLAGLPAGAGGSAHRSCPSKRCTNWPRPTAAPGTPTSAWAMASPATATAP